MLYIVWFQIVMKGSESLGFGIIEYKTHEEAQKSKVKLDNHMILDQPIRLTYCIPGKSGIFLCTRIITKFVSFCQKLVFFLIIIHKNYSYGIYIFIISQGSHYFEIRGRSDFSFRCWQKRNERQQWEVVRVQGEVKIVL